MDWRQLLLDGISLHRAGDLPKAMERYGAVLNACPNQPDALNLLGLAYHQSGQSERGAGFIAAAIQANDREPAYYVNLGLATRSLGHWQVAEQAYRKALTLAPELVDAWFNLGNLQRELGQPEAAIASYSRALQKQERAPDILNNLGAVHEELRHWPDAERCYRTAMAQAPQYADPQANLASLLQKLGRFEEAFERAQRAVELDPRPASRWVNLGSVCHDLGRFERSAECYREALTREPRNATAHMNLGMLLLATGRMPAGWEEYEWRLKLQDRAAGTRLEEHPLWDGTSLAGRTLLLRAEQGLGDMLQFARYIPGLAETGATLALECPAALVRLIGQLPCRVVAQGTPLPPCDCHAPLLSLPRLLRTTLEALPGRVPYLKPLANHAAPPLPPRERGKRIGLCWSGNPLNVFNLHRRIDPEWLLSWFSLPGCQFFSFQTGEPAAELNRLPQGARPVDLGGVLRDFADTAALAAQMDLIVTVDTSMAHLAGAMGLPVWTLLSFSPDWRWLRDREDSPWYPTMRLFRQRRPGDWAETLGRAREELAAWAVR